MSEIQTTIFKESYTPVQVREQVINEIKRMSNEDFKFIHLETHREFLKRLKLAGANNDYL